MLRRMAKESGVETPTMDFFLVQLDRKRKGKKLSNKDWTSPTDPDAKIARMKDGSSHLCLSRRLIWRPAWWWRRRSIRRRLDTATLGPTLEEAQKNLAAVDLTPTFEDPSDLVAEKGYHSRDGLKALEGGPWKTRIAEPKLANGYLRWHGDDGIATFANLAKRLDAIAAESVRCRPWWRRLAG
jgi:transposase